MVHLSNGMILLLHERAQVFFRIKSFVKGRQIVVSLLFTPMPSFRQLAKALEPICCYRAILLTGITKSVEHVVPVCRLQTPEARLDLQNVYSCDLALNIRRSSYRFADGEHELTIDNRHKIFVPTMASKGLIARTCLHMQTVHNIDLTEVIDEATMLEWLNYEKSDYEIRHEAYVAYTKDLIQFKNGRNRT